MSSQCAYLMSIFFQYSLLPKTYSNFMWNGSGMSANNIMFLDAVWSLVAETVRLDDVDGLQSQLNLALALME